MDLLEDFLQKKVSAQVFNLLGVSYAKINKGNAVNSQSESQLGQPCRADLNPDYIFSLIGFLRVI